MFLKLISLIAIDVIAQSVLGMVKHEPSIPISLIRKRIRSQTGFQISYRKAYKAKQKSIAKMFIDWDESYEMLPRWLVYMQMFTLDFIYKIEKIEFVINNQVDNRF